MHVCMCMCVLGVWVCASGTMGVITLLEECNEGLEPTRSWGIEIQFSFQGMA